MEILSKILINRLKLIVICIFMLFIGITAYLFHLQVNLVDNFFYLGQQNFLRSERVFSPRGNIVDSAGNLLATNRPINVIYWQGTGHKILKNNQNDLIIELTNSLNLSSETIQHITRAEQHKKRICLAYDVNFEQLSRIIEKFPSHKNLCIEREFKRYYPYNSIASHIVGYLGMDMASTGKMGLEFLCDNLLKGKSGEIIKTINSIGHNLSSYEIKKALAGQTIETTLNLNLQLIAEKLFPANKAGTCIIIDPQTGAIEVLLSRPNFDPNIFLNPICSNTWKDLQEHYCFINRALNACYPPASLFKLITISAALETKIIDQNSSWNCLGQLNFAGRLYHCKKREGHGKLNTLQSITHSCNIPFYDIGKKIKIDTLADYAKRLGLGTKTDIILKEKVGLVPTSQWKKSIKGERWWPGETLSATIGQSFILVTPIQIACMFSAICQGYLVRPRILATESVTKKYVDISKETLEFLKKSLEDVTQHGTARILNRLKNFEFCGKTGTAQTIKLSKIQLGEKFLEHAWFVAYFSYKNLPPKTMVILIEHAGSSSVAISMAYRFFKEYGNIYDSNNTIDTK